jgi:P27 family predicted phage terminase small subunit
MAITKVIVGGDGEPKEPTWQLIYSDGDEVELASECWARIIREMRDAHTLAVANGHAIRRLVDFRVIYERASRHVAEHGPVLPSKDKRSKNSGVHNPQWAVMRHADETIRHLETELGLAPLRRNRAGKVQRRDKAARASDAYLRPVKD